VRLARTICLTLAMLFVLPASVAVADDYGKNLLILKKALREGNCSQALEASTRMVEEEPERPGAYLQLADSHACLGDPISAFGNYMTYLSLGGTEDVERHIDEMLDGLPELRVIIAAVEVKEIRPFMAMSEYSSTALDEMPPGLHCRLDGVDADLGTRLAQVENSGCTVRVFPNLSMTVEIGAQGFQSSTVATGVIAAGESRDVETQLVRTRGSRSIQDGSWVSSTLAGHRAIVLDGDGGRHPVVGEPVWVPSGDYAVEYETDGGLQLLQSEVSVPADVATCLDLTVMKAAQLASSHGLVRLLPSDERYRVELTPTDGHDQAEAIVLVPDEPVDALSGKYDVSVFMRVGEEDGEVEVFSEEVELTLQAGPAASILEQAEIRGTIRATWFASVELSALPDDAVIWPGKGSTAELTVDAEGRTWLQASPGTIQLDVVAPWRERWHKDLQLAPRQKLFLEYDAAILAQRDRARTLRGIGTATLVAGGVATVLAAVLSGVASSKRADALAADAAYMDLDGGPSESDLYTQYDQQRRDAADSATSHNQAARVLLGVGGISLGVGFVLQIAAPRDPNRKVLLGLEPLETME
jgi:hypothetical protein